MRPPEHGEKPASKRPNKAERRAAHIRQQAHRGRSKGQESGILPVKPPRRPVTVNVEGLIARLRETPLSKMVQQWRNAREALDDAKKSHLHDGARKLLAAIDKEWIRRRHSSDPNDWFRWPDTEAPEGDGTIDAGDWMADGLLKFLGYRVGRTAGVVVRTRQIILSGLFDGQVPPVFPSDYLDQWGDPQSLRRLRKTAESLAAFTRNAKRRQGNRMIDAIRDWENDLDYLYRTYYVGHFHFGWPSSKL